MVPTRLLAFGALVLALGGCAMAGPAASPAASPVTGPVTGPAAEPTAASCGPGGHTTQVGDETRWTPCDYDYRTANVFIRGVLQVLPTGDVTVDAVDAAASGDELRAQQFGAAKYDGVRPDGTNLVATWVPSPVTCVVMTWDGTGWRSAITGELVSGGC